MVVGSNPEAVTNDEDFEGCDFVCDGNMDFDTSESDEEDYYDDQTEAKSESDEEDYNDDQTEAKHEDLSSDTDSEIDEPPHTTDHMWYDFQISDNETEEDEHGMAGTPTPGHAHGLSTGRRTRAQEHAMLASSEISTAMNYKHPEGL